MKILCKAMGIQRSSFYAWKKHLSHPSEREKNLASNVRLFQEYNLKYPSHGYRWLNAKIRLDKNIVLSDPYAHKCCKIAGIKSKSKHYRYKKAGDPARIFPNLLLSEMQIDGANAMHRERYDSVLCEGHLLRTDSLHGSLDR